MNKHVFAIIICLCLLVIPGQVFAHAEGKAYITINGQPVDKNIVNQLHPTESTEDIAAESYAVNEPLAIVYDADTYGVDPDQLRWDFGNGTKVTTRQKTSEYTYKKAGTFVMTLGISIKPGDAFADINTVLVHIKPSKNYVLPAGTINIQETSRNSKHYTLVFKASAIHDPSAQIARYDWSFGDNQKASGQTVTHTYKSSDSIAYPRVRITDSKGLYTDLVAQIGHDKDGKTTAKDANHLPKAVASFTPKQSADTSLYTFLFIGLAILALTGAGLILRRKLKHTR